MTLATSKTLFPLIVIFLLRSKKKSHPEESNFINFMKYLHLDKRKRLIGKRLTLNQIGLLLLVILLEPPEPQKFTLLKTIIIL